MFWLFLPEICVFTCPVCVPVKNVQSRVAERVCSCETSLSLHSDTLSLPGYTPQDLAYVCRLCVHVQSVQTCTYDSAVGISRRETERKAKCFTLKNPESVPLCSCRYAQFYSQDEFCHYNMFNHHFFDGEASSSVLQTFLRQSEGEKVVMVADPPFGGLVKPLANSFTLISQTWRKLQSSDSSDAEMPMIWIFPYFFEPRIMECLPSFTMLDYQVDYDNHPLYKHGKTGRRQSPVRLFTNICPTLVVLPKEEGYRFCSICQRYVCSFNKHCAKCNICPSKDGREWKHCSTCEKCVKPSWKHCVKCGHCALPDHPCVLGEGKKGCFTCGSSQHKHKACPLRDTHRNSRSQSNTKSGGKNLSHHPSHKTKSKRKSGAFRRAKKMAAQST